MSDEHAGDSGNDLEIGNNFSSAGNDDGSYIIDPDSIGSNQGTVRSVEPGNEQDSGAVFQDGYGPAGQYGKGRFPDGSSRKRHERGTRSAATGEAQVSEGRKSRASRSVNATGIEHLLIAIHYGASALLESAYENKIIPLQQDQAKGLSTAIANVARYYPELQTSGKIADHLVLIGTAASIYFPMGYFLYTRIQDERKEKARPRGGMADIFTIHGVGTGAK